MSAPVEQEIQRLLELVAQLRAQHRFEEAVSYGAHTLNLARAALGEDDPFTAASFGNLAEVYRTMGDYQAAEPLARAAVTIFRQLVGEEDMILAPYLNNLALVYQGLGNHGAAEPLLQQALTIQRRALGEEHPGVAVALDNLAAVHQETGNYVAAKSLRQQALAIARKTLDAHDPALATFLSNQATLFHIMGDYHAAEPLHLQALAIRREALGEEHPDLANNMNELALVYQSMGDYGKAEPLHRQALAIARRALGDQHPDTADYLSGLAQLLRVQGNYGAAEPLYREALAIRRKVFGDRHPAVSGSLNNLALLLRATGDYRAAEPLYREALTMARSLGEAPREIAIVLDNLATLYQETGDYLTAEPFYREALDIRREALGKNHPVVAETVNNLALLHYATGDYREAEALYRQALAIQRTVLGPEHPALAVTLNNLALLYRATGDYNAAAPLYREALAIRRASLGEQHVDVADSLSNLGVLSYFVGEHGLAESFYDQALAIYRKALGEEHPAVANAESNLASLYSTMGKYESADSLHRQALATRRKTLGEEHPDVAMSLNELAAVHDATGDYGAAEPLFQQALAIRRKSLGDEHPNVAVSLYNLAGVYAATDRADEAMSLMRQAGELVDRMIWQVFSFSSERQRMEYLNTFAGSLEAFLSLVLQHFAEEAEAVQQAFDLVLRRKGIGAEALAAQRDAVLGGRHPALEPALRELGVLRGQIARKTLAGPGPDGAVVHQRQLAVWNAQRERLESELARQIPDVNLEQRLRASAAPVATALPEGSALVEFVRFDVRDFRAVSARGEPKWQPARYVAFVLPAGSPGRLRLIDLGEAERIEELIASFRAWVAVRPERRTKANAGAGADLRARVFDPLLPAVRGITHLFLAADGDLSRLPFEVLPTGEGKFLIDAYHIRYVSVGRDVLRFGATADAEPEDPLVAASPDFDLFLKPRRQNAADAVEERDTERHSRDLERGSLHFAPLEDTREEGEAVAAMLGVTAWLQKDVLKARLKSSRSPRVLHLATHGFFLPNQGRVMGAEAIAERLDILGPGVAGQVATTPFARLVAAENPLLRSGLALAGVNTWARGGPLPPEAENGLLTAEDVTGLDLLATDLVVLSACETGLGDVRRGEGTFGLRRAFVLAGAKTLVLSLWRVPDEQTRTLMEDFYRRLTAETPEGISPATALRAAQLERRNQREFADPYFWGAFVCQGDPGPVRGLGRKMGDGRAEERRPLAVRSEASPTQPLVQEPASSDEHEAALGALLIQTTFAARGDGFRAGSALHQRALALRIGAPLHAGGIISYDDRDYAYQVFALDTLFHDVTRTDQVRRLAELIGGRLPTSGLPLALLEASYRAVGARLEASDVYYQVATAARLGYPLTRYPGGDRMFRFQVFSGDVLHDPLPRTVPKDAGSVRRLSEKTESSGDYLWANVYGSLEVPFDPASPIHRLASERWVGVPLAPLETIRVGTSTLQVQVFSLDTVYMREDGQPRQMSELAGQSSDDSVAEATAGHGRLEMKSPTDLFALAQLVSRFMDTRTLDDGRRFLEQYPQLLSDEARIVLDRMLDAARTIGNAGALFMLRERCAFLQRCREVGVDAAVKEIRR